MKGKWSAILLIVLFVAGLSFLLYPTVSNYWNSLHQSQVIVDYSQQVDDLNEEAYRQLWSEAETFNAALTARGNTFTLPEEWQSIYEGLLDPSGNGVMAYIEIPSISVTLPIGHGTGEAVLKRSVGHLEWSSLPIGGDSTHCVLSGHRGLPSSELFTNIDHLEIGDIFYIHILGESHTYRVDNIAVVEPGDYSLLGITEGKDYVTLVTCTPYGINSHRLLVRGVRVDVITGEPSTVVVGNEVKNIDVVYLVPVALAALAVPVFLISLAGTGKKKKGAKKHEEE